MFAEDATSFPRPYRLIAPSHCNNLERSTTKPQTAPKFIGLKWCWLEGGVVDKDSLGIMFDMSMVALGFKL